MFIRHTASLVHHAFSLRHCAKVIVMKSLFIPALSVLLMASAGSVAAQPAAETQTKTQSCLDNRSIKSTRFSSKQGYFAKSGNRWYQNKAFECPLFRSDRSIRTLSTIGQQCRGDQVEIFDPIIGISFGACALDNWVEVAADSVPKK